jgi:hypothetical protein
MVWTGSIWLRIGTRRALMNTVMNLLVRYNDGKFLSSYTTGGFSRRTGLREDSYTECNDNCRTLYFLARVGFFLPQVLYGFGGTLIGENLYSFFLNSHSGGWSPSWVHSARRPLNGLLYLPLVIMMMENLVE